MVQVGFRTQGTDGVLADLTRFRVNLTQAKPAFEEMAKVVVAAQTEQFKTEGRHYGNGWARLSPRYKQFKNRARPGKKILVFDGDLKRSAAPQKASGFDIHRITNKGMEVGISYAQTPNAEHHQEGTDNMPARIIMGSPTRNDQKAMTKAIHKHIMGGTDHARS